MKSKHSQEYIAYYQPAFQNKPQHSRLSFFNIIDKSIFETDKLVEIIDNFCKYSNHKDASTSDHIIYTYLMIKIGARSGTSVENVTKDDYGLTNILSSSVKLGILFKRILIDLDEL